MGKHTIVLLQPTGARSSRTFMDYETVEAAMDGICGIFEQKLKQNAPRSGQITYDIGDLYQFIDSLGDLSCLVLENTLYAPHNKQWVKERILQHLKKQAGGR